MSGFLPRAAPPLIRAMYARLGAPVGSWPFPSPHPLTLLSSAEVAAESTAARVGWHWFSDDVGATVGSDFISKIFNRPLEPGENPFPTHASLRASRAFEGTVRVAPVSYLDAVLDPGDLTEEELARVDLRKPVAVHIPLVGSPIVPRQQIPTLLKIRERGWFELAVVPRYV